MTCIRSRDEVLDLARRSPDAASEAVGATARVRAHLATCASCRALYEEQRAITAALRAVAHEASELSEQVDFEAMERRLFAQFEREKARPAAAVERACELDALGLGAEGPDAMGPDATDLDATERVGAERLAVVPSPAGARDAALSVRWRLRSPSPVQIPWLRVAALLVLVAGAAATWRVLGPADGTASRSPEAVSVRSPEPPAAILPLATGGAGAADTASGSHVSSAPATPGTAADAVPGLPPRRGGSAREGVSGGGGSLAVGVAGEGRGARPGSGPPARLPADPLAPRVVEAVGFVPLPLSDLLPPFERGEIVRVEVGVPSLPAYGVEMPSNVGDGPVLVDLLVGQDGLPRAIRLVTETTRGPRSR